MKSHILKYKNQLEYIEQNDISYMENIPEDDSFWEISRYILQYWIPTNISFSFLENNNKKTTLNDDILPNVFKLLNSQHGVSDDYLLTILDAIFNACSKSDWENFYKPLLLKDLELPFTIGQYNIYAKNKITFFEKIPNKKIEKYFNKEMFIEPHTDGPLFCVILYKNTIELLDSNFKVDMNHNIDLSAFVPVLDDNKTNEPILFLGNFDGDFFIIFDLLIPSIINQTQLIERNKILMDTFDDFIIKDKNILMVDRVLCKPLDFRKTADHINESGYRYIKIRENCVFSSSVDFIIPS